MASVTGGHYLFSDPTQSVNLVLNPGSGPSGTPISGDLNIEIFTAAGVSTTNPPPLDPGFQAEVVDQGGQLVNGFLTGDTITLFGGNYQIQDETTAGGGRDMITLGSGNQTVIGAGGDTIIGGSGNQEINAALQSAAGPETIIGGSGTAGIIGGKGNAITLGTGAQNVDGRLGSMTIAVGGAGGSDTIVGSTVAGAPDTLTGGAATADVQSLGKGDVVNFSAQSGSATINAAAGNDSVTLGSGAATVFGGVGDTITAGSGTQYIDGTAGGQHIAAGSGGSDQIFGSSVSGIADTITGGAAALSLQGLGKGDVVNLSAQSGAATVNAILGGATDLLITLGSGAAQVFANTGDTIALGSGNQYVDGTAGDVRIEVGSGGNDTIFGSTIAGAADTLTGGAGSAYVQSLGKGDIVNFSAQSGSATVNASAGDNVVTLGSGAASVFGGVGDTITFGSTGQYADGSAGGQTIGGGSGTGTDSVFGSAVAGGTAGDSIFGGNGSLSYNLSGIGTAAGGGDTINLTTGTGTATINAFNFAGKDQVSNDSIIAGSGNDSVFAGGGDTVGIGGNSTVGGTDIWSHADGNQTVGSVSFGTFDTLTGTTYGTTTFTTLAGGSHDNVTIGGAAGTGLGDFQPATTAGATGDHLFYQGETAAIDAKIVATAQSVTGGTQIALPDGTTMTLIGVTTTELQNANTLGQLFVKVP